MKKVTKILLSVFVPVVCVLSLTLGLVFGIKKDADFPAPQQEQQEVPVKYDIPGVYYASAEEETGALSAPRNVKAGSIYVGDGSDFTMSSGTVRQHSATYGGAVYVAAHGTFTMTGGMIVYNRAQWGGAIYVEKDATCILNGGTITCNASETAMAIYVEDGGILVVDGCDIINNFTELNGNFIDYYVDEMLVKVVSCGANTPIFNLADAPLGYNNCIGYFTDEELTSQIDNGENIGQTVVSVAATNEQWHSFGVYTYQATTDDLIFTLNQDNQSYSVASERDSETYNEYTFNYATANGRVIIPLTYNNLPVTTIGEMAFKDAINMTEIFIPSSVNTLGEQAFYCTRSNSGKGNEYQYFQYKNAKVTSASGVDYVAITNLKTVKFAGDSPITEIPEECFRHCMDLRGISLPETVVELGHKAFAWCSALKEIHLSSNLTTITGEGTFQYAAFESIDLPSTLTTIPAWCFQKCECLNGISIPSGVTSIGNNAFDTCTNLSGSITIPNTVTNIGERAFFHCEKVENITISNNVTSINASTFEGCLNMTNLTIGSNVTSIGNFAFAYCSELSDITISNIVTSIGDSAFRGCVGLNSVTIGTGVTSLGDSAFRGCSNLTEINYNANISTDYTDTSYVFHLAGQQGSGITLNIGNNVTSIPAYIFSGPSAANAPKIIRVTIGSDVKTIGNQAFLSCGYIMEICNLSNLDIKTGQYDNGKVALSASYVTDDPEELYGSVMISRNVKYYVSGKMTDKIAVGLVDNSASTILFDDDCTIIKENAFENITTLTNITLPNNLKYIGDSAFRSCSGLTGNIIIPNGVTYIGKSAFSDCSGITGDLIIPNGLTSINDSTFFHCNSLTGAVIIPDSVTVIGTNAFAYCSNISSLTIGSGVTSIGTYAFSSCWALQEINYNATNYIYGNIFDSAGKNGSGIAFKIGNNVVDIPSNLFYNLFNYAGNIRINSVTIGSGVTSIGSDAFKYAAPIEAVIINSPIIAGLSTSLTDTGLFDNDPTIYVKDTITDDNIGDFVKYSRFIIKVSNDMEGYNKYQYGINFGLYPQTYVGNVMNTELESWYNVNNPTAVSSYQVGNLSNNAKRTWHAYTYTDGNLYARGYSSAYTTTYHYSDGSAVQSNKYVWFKVEPVKWLVLNYDEIKNGTASTMILYSRFVLASNVQYYKNLTDDDCNEWYKSELRAWLNYDFLYSACTIDEIERIDTVEILNNITGSTGDGSGFTTYDQVYLPSYSEMSGLDHGPLKKNSTDFALVNYQNNNAGNASYWLRSSGNEDIRAYYINGSGNNTVIQSNAGVTHMDYGVCPMISISDYQDFFEDQV